MAIAPRPKQHSSQSTESKAETFIAGASKTVAPSTEPALDELKRKPVLIRFPEETLARIDQAAARKGLSRSAYVSSSMADLLNGE